MRWNFLNFLHFRQKIDKYMSKEEATIILEQYRYSSLFKLLFCDDEQKEITDLNSFKDGSKKIQLTSKKIFLNSGGIIQFQTEQPQQIFNNEDEGEGEWISQDQDDLNEESMDRMLYESMQREMEEDIDKDIFTARQQQYFQQQNSSNNQMENDDDWTDEEDDLGQKETFQEQINHDKIQFYKQSMLSKIS